MIPSIPLKPKQVGGTLIRSAISWLKSQGEMLPWGAGGAPVYLSVSGGVDSVALLVLLSRYGRNIVNRDSLRVIHFNHRWRADESDGDQAYLESLCREWSIPFEVRFGSPAATGASREEAAREDRVKVYQEIRSEVPAAIILLAHHLGDTAETYLWKLFTGQIRNLELGIEYSVHNIRRPFLNQSKSDFQRFLKEEGVSWREDRTNLDSTYLRNRIRAELLPLVEELFPGFPAQLKTRLEGRGAGESASGLNSEGLSLLGRIAGFRPRSAHHEAFSRGRPVDLPEGWRLEPLPGTEKNNWKFFKALPD